MIRAALALLLLSGCAAQTFTADRIAPAQIPEPSAPPSWPEIEPRATADGVVLTPEDAAAIGGYRDAVGAWVAEALAWGGYWRAIAGGADGDGSTTPDR